MLKIFVKDLCNHHLHASELAIMSSLIINDTEMLFKHSQSCSLSLFTIRLR